jgi:hypothetical protein
MSATWIPYVVLVLSVLGLVGSFPLASYEHRRRAKREAKAEQAADAPPASTALHQTLRGHCYIAALREFDDLMRSRVKHMGLPTISCDEVRASLREILGDHGIDIDGEAP